MRIALFAAVLSLPVLAACGPDNGGYDPAPPADAPADASPAAPQANTADFDLVGTEPFWAVKIRAEGLTLTRPDQPPVTTPNPGPVADGAATTWTSGPLGVRLTPGECSDGMSDRTYPYAAVVTTPEGELRGCGAPPVDFSEARP